MTKSESNVLLSGGVTGGDVADYFTRCGDCGRFVNKSRWIRKDNPYGYTHALCCGCLSNYDD